MALSRTLIRTYAMQYPDQPEMTLRAANERILNDTQSDLFVTVFYGVLDLEKGFLNYCNAGHNPGYMCHLENGHTVDTLGKTGIPLGMFENFTWRSDSVTFEEGAVLLLYSDGLTEAHNADEELFGDDRLLALVETHKDLPVQQIHYRIIESVQAFVGDTPQFDDITLMMVQRSSPTL
jgi:sigma-B regulation protein RsbU (phosphoserine phosphatase)